VKNKNKVNMKKLLFEGLMLLVVLAGYLGIKIYLAEKVYLLEKVIDGDTVILTGGVTANLVGVDTKGKGEESVALSEQYLRTVLFGKNIWFEREGRGANQGWLWIGCEKAPKFIASDLRKIFSNQWGENPLGCEKGVLINEQIVGMGWSEPYFEGQRGNLRYEQRLRMAGE